MIEWTGSWKCDGDHLSHHFHKNNVFLNNLSQHDSVWQTGKPTRVTFLLSGAILRCTHVIRLSYYLIVPLFLVQNFVLTYELTYLISLVIRHPLFYQSASDLLNLHNYLEHVKQLPVIAWYDYFCSWRCQKKINPADLFKYPKIRT